MELLMQGFGNVRNFVMVSFCCNGLMQSLCKNGYVSVHIDLGTWLMDDFECRIYGYVMKIQKYKWMVEYVKLT